MEIEKIKKVLNKIKEEKPLIHSITNPISINQCANAVLSLGARPIMAEHPKEVSDITKSSKALLINLGNITDVRMESMKISILKAKEKNIPYIIDAVGVSCSLLRKNFLKELIKISRPSIIKGNYSEVMALYNESYLFSGVDADNVLTIEEVKKASIKLSKDLGTVILASGKVDIAVFGENICLIYNGTQKLSSVTGTGCMLGIIAATFLSFTKAYDAAILAALYLGVCGEIADKNKGNGSFLIDLFDAMSTVNSENIERRMKISYEKI